MPKVTIVTVNYNGKKFLAECMDSLKALEYPEGGFEVVMVDNASSDGSSDFIRENYPWVKLIVTDRNLGFAGGNNVGMKLSEGDFVALVNNDTKVDPAWLIEMVKVAESDPRVGIATSKMLFMDRPNIINNAGSFVLPNGWGSDRGFEQEDKGQFEVVEEVFSACGASMLLRKSMLDEIGLFDESFFCYYEDVDLSWRARLAGWKIVYTPLSFLYHKHSGTSVEWSEFFTYHVLRNRHFMLLKNAWWGLFFRSLLDFLKRTVLDAGIRGKRIRANTTNPNYFRLDIRLRVFWSLLTHLPALIVKRKKIRRKIKVNENMLKRWIITGRRPVGQA